MSAPSPQPSARRPRLIRAATGLVVAFALVGVARPVSAQQFDLAISSPKATGTPGGAATIVLDIANDGDAVPSGIGGIITLATPPYVNIDRNRPLPNIPPPLNVSCFIRYENLDRAVPELLRCVFSTLPSGGQVRLEVPVVVHPLSPSGTTTGTVSISTITENRDLTPSNNSTLLQVNVATTAAGANPTGDTNLAISADSPAFHRVDPTTGAAIPNRQTFKIRNNGPATTRGPLTFTYSLPLFTQVTGADGDPFPADCVFLTGRGHATEPLLLQCQIPAGMAAGEVQTIDLESISLDDPALRPEGNSPGIATVRVDDNSGDVDPDRADNFIIPLVNNIARTGGTPSTFAPARGGRAIPPGPGPSPLREPIVVTSTSDSKPVAEDSADAPGGPRLATTGGGARVDLNLSFDEPTLTRGGTGVQQLIVGNTGADATGLVRLVYVLPLYVNIDRGPGRPGLPSNCQMLYSNLDFSVNEIVQCELTGPRNGTTATVRLPLVAAPSSEPQTRAASAIVMPAPTSNDAEQFTRDNLVQPLVVLEGSEPPLTPGSNLVDLYTSSVVPSIRVDQPARALVTIGNKGPDATSATTRLTFVTPIFTNIDRARALPAGCSFLYQNLDPMVPEVVECLVPESIPAGGTAQRSIPLKLGPRSPTSLIVGALIARPQANTNDVDISPIDNAMTLGISASNMPTRSVQLYLHGGETPRTAGQFTMNETRSGPSISLLGATTWLSNPTSLGTFTRTTAFALVIPCTLGVRVGATASLAVTDANGVLVRTLGQATLPLTCVGTQRIPIPVVTPISVDSQRLRLTVAALVNLQVASGTYLEVTDYRGLP